MRDPDTGCDTPATRQKGATAMRGMSEEGEYVEPLIDCVASVVFTSRNVTTLSQLPAEAAQTSVALKI
jgi:hypothetical protein